MNYEIYKLSFTTPVHFGAGRLSGSVNTVYADTLFSALCCEAVKLLGADGADRLCSLAWEKGLRLSDALPYCGSAFFIPKPILPVSGDTGKQGDSKLKKEFKRLNYIPVGDLSEFLSGSYNPAKANEMLKGLGSEGVSAKVSIKNDSDNLPYTIGTYSFSQDCGLYFIAAAQAEEALCTISDLMDSLSYTGIGGKLSSGYGKFDYTILKSDDAVSVELKKRLELPSDTYMSLSISMAADEELSSVADNTSMGYELIKRSGFVASYTYTDTPVRKRDLFCFKAGSCFNKPFNGNIFDVSSVIGGSHSVYRYAMPLFIGI